MNFQEMQFYTPLNYSFLHNFSLDTNIQILMSFYLFLITLPLIRKAGIPIP